MIGLGTIINVAAIICGGIMGLLFGKKMSERFHDILMKGAAVCVLFLGIGGCLAEMLVATEDGFTTQGTMMMIVCMAVGGIIGEALKIEQRIEHFGEWLKIKTKSQHDTAFVDAFVTASVTVCIGAMAVVGALTDGLTGDYSILLAKAILDFIIIMIMTASMGKGCAFSAIPVGIFQGVITLLARFVEPLMTEQALSNLSLTGSMLIFCVGVNLLFGKKVSVANLLPAIFLAVGWAFLPI
jgi:uncharacterized membrane protein YqgA involved in biofilm formation